MLRFESKMNPRIVIHMYVYVCISLCVFILSLLAFFAAKMAEFVEFSLEKLLPAFESLISSKLFLKAEVDERIKHFRRYEYQLAKKVGFFAYYEFLIKRHVCRQKHLMIIFNTLII